MIEQFLQPGVQVELVLIGEAAKEDPECEMGILRDTGPYGVLLEQSGCGYLYPWSAIAWVGRSDWLPLSDLPHKTQGDKQQ